MPGLLGLRTTLPWGVYNVLQDSYPRTKQGGWSPLKMNSTTAWVFSDFMELHTITHHLDRVTCRKRRSHGQRYTSLLLMYAKGPS